MSTQLLTIDDVQRAVPANLKRAVSQSMVDTLNNIAADPLVAEEIRNNFISYTGVLKDGKFKTEDYISAVMYVSFKLMGDTNKEAWCKTFPQRYQILVARSASEKEISAHVAAYSKGQLVNKVLEQSMVPTHVLNADLYQKALNVQADLMMNASSEKVRSDAANSILVQLRRPDAVKGEIDVNIKDTSGMNELRNVLGDVARQQRQLLEGGADIKTITHAKIIEHEPAGNNDGS